MNMKRIMAVIVICYFLLSTIAVAQPAVSVYDPIARKNMPADKMSTEKIKQILDEDHPAFLRWSNKEMVRELYESRIMNQTETRVQERPKTGDSLSKQDIIDRLGFDIIYDPIARKNRFANSLTREELVCFLNNPFTHQKSFNEQESKWVRAMLKNMNLVGPGTPEYAVQNIKYYTPYCEQHPEVRKQWRK